MFRPTNRQISLLEPAFQLPESQARRLRESWADGFRQEVLPLLFEAENEFSALYDEGQGRPNWSVARILGILLLQEMLGYDDQSSLDSLCFDVRWQHALGIAMDEGYLSRRSLVDFRSRLVGRDAQMSAIRQLFESIAASAVSSLSISTKEQRLDSTLITSNIFTRGRVELFRKTILQFLNELSKTQLKKIKQLPQSTQSWFSKTKKTNWFGGLNAQKTKQTLLELAKIAYDITETFKGDEDVDNLESYQLVARVLEEHCEFTTDKSSTDSSSKGDGGKGSGSSQSDEALIKVLKQAKKPGQSLQSPYDPDAGCGHKGPGYSLQVTETCHNRDVGTEVITDYDVTSAEVSDRHKDAEVLSRLIESGHQPEVLYADGGYTTGQGLIDSKARGTELIAPVSRGRLSTETIGRDQFSFNADGDRCIKCPKGHSPSRHDLRTTGKNHPPSLHAYFDGATCRSCPLLSRCIVRAPNSGKKGSFHLEVGAHLLERDKALTLQKEPPWRERYKIRSGIEATMSELKRAHGIGKLRVRRMARVKLAVGLKICACNIKRWLRASSLRLAVQ